MRRQLRAKASGVGSISSLKKDVLRKKKKKKLKDEDKMLCLLQSTFLLTKKLL